MILFFYGEDNYRLRAKVNQLKAKFIDVSLGDTNLSVLDDASLTYDNFIRQILAMPFLAKSRLVIIENVMKIGKKEVLEKIPEALSKVPSSTVLVFIEESNPDKRTSLFKKLNKPGISQEFKLLDNAQLYRWIKKEVEDRDGSIDSAAINKLVEYIGSDLWRMSNELDKLTAYRLQTTEKRKLQTGHGLQTENSEKAVVGSQLTVSDIELLVNPQIESNVFNMVEAVAKKDHQTAVKELYKLLNSGEHELYVLTMLVWQYRNLLIIKDLIERTGNTNSWTLAKQAALSPFVVQKGVQIAQKYTLKTLKKIYATLLSFDIAIKTGKMEARTALELLIYRLTT